MGTSGLPNFGSMFLAGGLYCRLVALTSEDDGLFRLGWPGSKALSGATTYMVSLALFMVA